MIGLSPEQRAARMIPILDRRHDAAWSAAHPELHRQWVQMLSDEPYTDEPRRALGARLQLEARAGHDVWDRLSTIAAQTLICAGRYDGQAPPENQEAMTSRIPDATLRFFEGGHVFLWEDLAAYREIEAFLLG
jgi:3-oxoadipate enol-lactonase